MANILEVAARYDKALEKEEAAVIAKVNQRLQLSYDGLRGDLERYYETQEGIGSLQARLMVRRSEELKNTLARINPEYESYYEEQFSELLSTANSAGYDLAGELVAARSDEVLGSFTAVPYGAIAAQARDGAERLKGHTRRFQNDAIAIIEDGLVRGQDASWVKRQLADKLDITKKKAEDIARTEVNSAYNTAAALRYEQGGIAYGQLLVTPSTRLCPFCAGRNGNVYLLGQITVPLHVRCRCTLLPWRKEWQKLGLTEDSFLREYHRQGILELRRNGAQPNYTGAAPFERAAGRDKAPRVVWSARRQSKAFKEETTQKEKSKIAVSEQQATAKKKKPTAARTLTPDEQDAEFIVRTSQRLKDLRGRNKQALAEFQKNKIGYSTVEKIVKEADAYAKELKDKLLTRLSVDGERVSVTMHGMAKAELLKKVRFAGIDFYASTFERGSPAMTSILDMVESGWFPRNLSRHTSAIAFTSQPNKEDAHWEKRYKIKNFVSGATGGDGRVVVYNGLSRPFGTFAHEMGHNLAKVRYGHTSPPASSDFGIAAKMSSPPTDYGKASIAEDFADSVKLYVQHENGLRDGVDFKQSYRSRYKIIDRLMKDEEYGG